MLFVEGQGTSIHDKLFADIFRGYVKETPPLKLTGRPIIVNVTLDLVAIKALVGLSNIKFQSMLLTFSESM